MINLTAGFCTCPHWILSFLIESPEFWHTSNFFFPFRKAKYWKNNGNERCWKAVFRLGRGLGLGEGRAVCKRDGFWCYFWHKGEPTTTYFHSRTALLCCDLGVTSESFSSPWKLLGGFQLQRVSALREQCKNIKNYALEQTNSEFKLAYLPPWNFFFVSSRHLWFLCSAWLASCMPPTWETPVSWHCCVCACCTGKTII